jgi:hypothetical protein
MATSDNILQAVQTYNDSGLAFLSNSYAFLSKCNSKFKNFENIQGQKGTTVGFDRPPRFTTTGSLVVSFQSAEQLVETLTVNQEESVAYEFSAQQFIYNVRDYMDKFGKSAMIELGTKVESNIAEVCKTTPYRFYGDGVTPLTSYLQLAKALAFFRNFGAAKNDTCAFLDDLTFPNIVNSGLNQFTLERNNREANSWEIGKFSNCEWYQSNLLPTHTAGTEGIQGSTLTVVSTTTNAAGAVTAITFSGCNAASDADSVKENDSFQFSDGVSGQPDMRFLTYIGHVQSQNPVQFRASADAASTGGSQVTVTIDPPLQATAGKDQNINNAIVANMECTVLPSHRCGLIMAGNPLYLAMPKLPEEVPFPTAISTDPETGVSIRTYFGSQFGQNARGMVHDCLWDKKLIADYAMKVALPL